MALGTQVEYAAHRAKATGRSCSKQMIGKYKDQGRLVMIDGKVDFEASDKALGDTLDPGMGGNRAAPVPGPSQGSFLDAKTTVTEYAAKTAALNWSRESGLVVDAYSVESEQHSLARKIRDRMLRVDREVAEEVAGNSDPRECRAIVRRAIERALIEVADMLEQGEPEAELDIAAE